MTKIKCCPFCGQSGIIHQLENGQYYPRCTGGSGAFCLLTRLPDVEKDGFIHQEDAIKVWNRRKVKKTIKSPPVPQAHEIHT